MRLVAATLLLIALSMPVQAEHLGCATDSSARPVQAQGQTFYVTTECPDGCTAGIWVYQETNGKPGLQRDDSGSQMPDGDACGRSDLRMI